MSLNTKYNKSNKENKPDRNLGDFYIACPWCDEILYIEKVKCSLFLHAFNTRTKKNIGPHTKREKIEKIRESGELEGCGGRFKILEQNRNISTICCNH